MNTNKLLHTMRSGWSPIVVIAVTTLAIIAISIYCLASGYFIIFQNLFYIPIIIACVYYIKRGFAFSVIIACLYFLLTIAFTRESSILLQAFVRVLIFVLVAGIITYLSLARKRVEDELRKHRDNLENLVDERTAELEIANKTLQGEVAERYHLVNVLQTEKMNFYAVFEASPVAMLVIDETTNIVMVNLAGISMCGGDKAEILQHRPGNALRCVHRSKDKRGCGYSKVCKLCKVRNNVEGLIAKGGAMHGAELEMELERNGAPSQVWMSIGVESLLLDGREHWCIALEDITGRKQAEQALGASEARFKSLVETQSDLIARSDLDGHLTFVNDAYCKTFGKTREELLGKSFSPTVFPEDKPTVTAMIKAIQLPPYHMQTETRHPTPAGIHWFSWDNAAVLNESGKVQELQGIGRDITDRKQAEQAFRNSEVFNQALIAASPIGISVRSRTGDLLSSNAAWRNIWAIPKEEYQEMLEQKSNELIFDEKDVILLPYQEQVRQVYEQGGSMNLPDLKTRYYRPGNAEWVSQYYYAIMDDQGKVDRVVTLTEDISARKRAEEALQQKVEELHASNKELAQFNRASVGRELRMIELKEEINELCRRLGEAPRHATDQLQADNLPGAGSAPGTPGGGGIDEL